jgi:hypothetical protein
MRKTQDILTALLRFACVNVARVKTVNGMSGSREEVSLAHPAPSLDPG